MELLVRKLRTNYQELLNSRNNGGAYGKKEIKAESQCLIDIDETIDEIENALTEPDKKLQHHYDTTIGLYAIDFNPKELIKRFVDSQSDATRLLVEDVEDLVEDWEKWIKDENIGKSPFFQIK